MGVGEAGHHHTEGSDAWYASWAPEPHLVAPAAGGVGDTPGALTPLGAAAPPVVGAGPGLVNLATSLITPLRDINDNLGMNIGPLQRGLLQREAQQGERDGGAS